MVAADPDTVIVQGSVNDVRRPGDDLRQAAAALYSQLVAELPSADVVVLGPLASPAFTDEQTGQVRDALAWATSRAGIPFIDPLAASWLVPADGLFSDLVHPNSEGYDQMADELAAGLRKLGL